MPLGFLWTGPPLLLSLIMHLCVCCFLPMYNCLLTNSLAHFGFQMALACSDTKLTFMIAWFSSDQWSDSSYLYP